MSSNNPEHPDEKARSSNDEDWADAWDEDAPEPVEEQEEPVADDSPLPPRRDPVPGAGVHLIGSEQGQSADLEDGQETPGRSKTLKVRNISAEYDERLRLRPSGVAQSKEVNPAFLDRQNIEEKEWSAPTAINIKWGAIISVLIIAVVVGAFVYIQFRGPTTKAGTKSNKNEREKVFEAIQKELDVLRDRREEARKLYADFASAQVVEEILPMIRNAQELKELVRRTGHQTLVNKEWQPSPRAKWVPNLLRSVPKPFATLHGELPDFNNFRAYFVMEGEDLLLDWKATIAYSTASFEDLAQGKGDGREVRGYMKSADLFTSVWPADEYQCYQLESPDRREVLWCYVKRSSDVAKQLGVHFLKGEILEQRDKELPMTLRLGTGPERSLPNQWLIEGLLHEEWIQMQ